MHIYTYYFAFDVIVCLGLLLQMTSGAAFMARWQSTFVVVYTEIDILFQNTNI